MSYDTPLDAALTYSGLGWRVLPIHSIRCDGICTCGDPHCASPAKHPVGKLVPHGVKNATSDETQIRHWWTLYPNANVGIATGKFLVLDVDLQNGGDLANLDVFGELPFTVAAATGGGGYHVIFALPDPTARVPCSSGVAGLRGIDVRADGGYIVAPPSRHVSGGGYEWLYAPEDYPLTCAPTWLIALACGPSRAGAVVGEPQVSILAGERNKHLHRIGRVLHARGSGESVILAALKAENATRCDPPLSDEEVAEIAHKAGTQPDSPDFAARRTDDATSHATPRRRFELIDDEAILRREPPPWLIQDILPLGGLAVLAGTAASLKTFLAIHMGFSVATGTPWAGRHTQQGLVVYIVAEGGGGFSARLEAWKQEHGCLGVVQGFFTLPCPVEFMQKGDLRDLLAELGRLPAPPVLIIVDTLARCFVGGEENSAKDMGLFTAGVDRLRHATGAAVLVVHHSGWERGRERGSTALRLRHVDDRREARQE